MLRLLRWTGESDPSVAESRQTGGVSQVPRDGREVFVTRGTRRWLQLLPRTLRVVRDLSVFRVSLLVMGRTE